MKKCKVIIPFVDGNFNSFAVGRVYELRDDIAGEYINKKIMELVEEEKQEEEVKPLEEPKKKPTRRRTRKVGVKNAE